MGDLGKQPQSGSGVFLPDLSRLDPLPREEVGAPAPRIEGYIIESCLGRGGMGTVWRAVQISTRRAVAIKVMAEQLFSSEKARMRFEREVELAARLAHPRIARVYESGLSRGLYYYTMQYVEGLPLDVYVAKHHLNEHQILELVKVVALAVRHAQGQARRDPSRSQAFQHHRRRGGPAARPGFWPRPWAG